MSNVTSSVWAVLPAAGAGRRMESGLPKQYLQIQGKTILEHSLGCLLSSPQVAGAVVVLHPDDDYYATLNFTHVKPVITVGGGAERSDSVLNALRVLATLPTPPTWAVIHDAARPCLPPTDLERLLRAGLFHPDGALLAFPCRDTMKRADDGQRVATTVARDRLWHALTPQLFPLRILIQAHQKLLDDDVAMTDDAMAMEYSGYHPRLVAGSELNIKVTRPDDLVLANAILSASALRE